MAVSVALSPLLCAVYSQSWPIPKPNMTVAKTNCFPSGKSLNSDWVQGKVKRNSQTAFDKRKVARARSAYSERTSNFSRRSLFAAESDGNDEEISEMARDLKLTLQLFKRLSQQVREVNQHMNRNKAFTYKHYLNNEGVSSPALRRSQLAVALSKREIPATEAPFEPIVDVGTPVPTAQPHLQENENVRVYSRHVPTSTSPKLSSSVVKFKRSSSHPNINISTESTSQKLEVKAPSEKELGDADTAAKEQWITECSDFKELFVVNPTEYKALHYQYHDPFPDNWVNETVENVIFRGSKKKDLFMQRLFELGKLEEETIVNERKKDKEYSNLVFVKQQLSQKNKRQVGVQTGLPTSRAISARLPSNHISRPKSKVKVCRSYSARRATNSVHSGDDNSEHSRIQTLRNAGYKLGESFVPGSLFPKTREIATQFDDKTAQKHGFLKTSNSLGGMHKDVGCKSTKSQFCQICKMKTSSSTKHSCTRNNTSLHTLRTQYELKAAESYDITELAKTLEPPCKDQMKKSGEKTPAENTSLKGIIPGKSCFSQRRISLTLDNLLVNGVNTRAVTARCKSGKRTAKKKLPCS